MGKWFITAGTLLLLVGLALLYAPWIVNWFGKLPGDIRYESGNTRVHIPITSTIVVSVLLSILVSALRR